MFRGERRSNAEPPMKTFPGVFVMLIVGGSAFLSAEPAPDPAAPPKINVRDFVDVIESVQADEKPRVVFQTAAQYPLEMRKKGISGEVVVGFIVNSEGAVEGAHVMTPTHPEFEKAAVDAVSKWKFTPGKKGGRAVAMKMAVPIRFSLIAAPAPPSAQK
jgi:TonB family protein